MQTTQKEEWMQVYTGTARMTVITKRSAESSYAVRVSALNKWGQGTPCAPQVALFIYIYIYTARNASWNPLGVEPVH